MLISARRVAPTGTAIGLDMTDEVLELARRNQTDAGVTSGAKAASSNETHRVHAQTASAIIRARKPRTAPN